MKAGRFGDHSVLRMRTLVFLTLALYHCSVLQGADDVSPQKHLGYMDHSLIGGIASELGEVKSILNDQKVILEELKNQGQSNGE